MTNNTKQTYENIKLLLNAAVPLRILALQEKGGPIQEDFKRVSRHCNLLGEHGDALMFKVRKKD